MLHSITTRVILLIATLTLAPWVSPAQDSLSTEDTTEYAGRDSSTVSDSGDTEAIFLKEEAEPDESFHAVIRQQFLNGDWRFMTPVLFCLLIGLVISVDRIVRLNLATSNVDRTLTQLRDDLNSEGVDQAIHRLQGKRDPVAIVFRQSLGKWDDGIAMVEKAIDSYGAVETGKLEKGLVWISLFISIAPMLGFMGTVIGMINAFDAIEAAGDISPTLVASGIKTALLTTVAGLIVAIILQLFYNYCVAKIDRLVTDLERASIALVDVLADYRSAQATV